MEKMLSLLLALCLLLSASTALALDVAFVTENPGIYTMNVDNEGDAFITTALTVPDRAFTHQYESANYWSSTQFDILVVDYTAEEAIPVWRLWINYAADNQYQHFEKVTFHFGGYSFTFTDVSSPDWQYMLGESYVEQMLIQFGMMNVDFFIALEKYCDTLDDDMANFVGTMTLHGEEDIVIDLGQGFALDFVLTKMAYVQMDGLATIQDVYGTMLSDITADADEADVVEEADVAEEADAADDTVETDAAQ